MARVMKSPNMMSTTGRIPAMAAPTASPVMPASEMGESMTRAGPNSSTRPDSTLNGVPASATSSPMMNTVGSRRISSASASRTACPNVISRVATTVDAGSLVIGNTSTYTIHTTYTTYTTYTITSVSVLLQVIV